ncbi:hypothetical protein [Ferruginibacter sp.]
MRILKSTLFIFAAIAVFISCQKELKYDNDGVSTGTFKKDAAGDCAPVTVNGVFKVDSTLNSNYYVDVQVNVSYPGTFDIRTDTVNGFWFNKAGSVVLGTNTIRLYASGKPVLSGTNTFTVKYGTGAGGSTCTFDITVVGPAAGPAIFTLSGAPGGCTLATPGGTYTVNTPLTPANTLTVQVNVTALGTYNIVATNSTLTAGFSFSGTGLFTSLGVQNVTLTGTGTPTTAGNIPFSVTPDLVNFCNVDIPVQAAGGGAAVFTFQGNPGNCTTPTINGTYTIGTAVSSATNTVILKVDVTTAGTYTISTNTLDGITFSATGTLAVGTGQTITLAATGTPTGAAGTRTFKPNVANSCDFVVTYVAAPPVPNNDYFPLTNNSWWSYFDSESSAPSDTLYNVIYGTKAYNSNTYTEMQDNYANVPGDTAHYRKSGNDYWEWMPTDYYSYGIYFEAPAVYTDFNFLKENATAGTTWRMPATGSYSGNVDDGSGTLYAATMYYNLKIIDPNTTLTVNSVTFSNVIHMTVTPMFTIPGLGISNLDTETDDYYYAKGIGLIKIVVNFNPLFGITGPNYPIKNYKVF